MCSELCRSNNNANNLHLKNMSLFQILNIFWDPTLFEKENDGTKACDDLISMHFKDEDPPPKEKHKFINLCMDMATWVKLLKHLNLFGKLDQKLNMCGKTMQYT